MDVGTAWRFVATIRRVERAWARRVATRTRSDRTLTATALREEQAMQQMGNGQVDRRVVLSTLWIVVLLNIVFRDIHEFLRPGYLQEVMTGSVNGNPMTEEALLVGGIGASLQIAMVLASRVLPVRINRWANVVVGAAAMGGIVYFTTAAPPDLDDVFFATVELTALAAIVWLAWTWPRHLARGRTAPDARAQAGPSTDGSSVSGAAPR